MEPDIQIVFDAADPATLATFWQLALGYRPQPPPAGFESWETWAVAAEIPKERWNDRAAILGPEGRRPRIFLQRVPEPKRAKNRVHLDINVGALGPADQRAELVDSKVDQLVAAGATLVQEVREHDERHIVLQDPEGNEFCVQ